MPLVEAPDSRYHLRDWDELTYWEPMQYISEGLLPRDPGMASINGDSNSALLIVANFADSHKKKGGKSYELAKKLLNIIHQMRGKDGFHAYGPVRVLMWIPENLRNSFLPKTVAYRGRLSLQLEMICHMEEIIQSGEGARSKERRRPELLDIESSIRVLREMEKKNIYIPALRQNDVHKRALESLRHSGSVDLSKVKDPLGLGTTTHRDWHRELEQLEKDFRDSKYSQSVHVSMNTQPLPEPHTFKKLPSGFKYTPEYLRLVELQRHMRHSRKNEHMMESLFRDQGVIDSLELDTFNDELDVLERETKLRELKSLIERFDLHLEQLSARLRMQYTYNRDDRKALAQDPPLLMWDRRMAEPLVAHENEVYPTAPFSLLDLQPHPPELYPMTSEQRLQFDLIMRVLFVAVHRNISMLDAVAPGAFNAIVPQVSALRNPFRGGCRDVSRLEAHMLTREMAHGITMAWDEWSSKPSIAQLLLKIDLQGSSIIS